MSSRTYEGNDDGLQELKWATWKKQVTIHD